MASPQPELTETMSEESDFEESDTDSLAKELRELVMEQTMKNIILLNEQTDDSPDLKRYVIKVGNTEITSEMELLMFKTQTSLIETQLKRVKSEIRKTEKFFTAKEGHIKILEDMHTSEICTIEEFSNDLEKTSEDAKTHFVEARKTEEELDAVIEKLTDETPKSEISKVEEILNKYLSYKNFLFNLLRPQQQETQEAETLKAKGLIDKDDQNEMNAEPQETAVSTSLERDLEPSPGGVLPSTKDNTLSSAYSNTIVTDFTLDVNSTGYQENLELYFSDPQQLVGLILHLTEQNLSQIQNSIGMDKILEQTIEAATEKMKKEKDRLLLQVDDMKDRIGKEQERAVMLRKQVQLLNSIKTQDKDIMLEAVGRKVTDVYLCFVTRQLTYLTTTKKLASVENNMSLLLQQIESIPEDSYKTLRHIKEMERRNRLREEKLQLEMEKEKEKIKKCMIRSMGGAKKTTGRKLMPRCFPVKQNIQVTEEAPVSPEEDLYAYLFSEDSD